LKPAATNILWQGDGRWITTTFVGYLVGLSGFAVSGHSKIVLAGTDILVALVCLLGFAGGLRSARMFGGRRNFTGRLLLLLSVSLLMWGLAFSAAIPFTVYSSNVFLDNSVLGASMNVPFVLGILIAAYALVRSAWAVVSEFNRTVVSRMLIALTLVLVVEFISSQATVRLTPGLTILGAFEGDLPYTVSLFALGTGALVLVAQLGKWYATQGIRIVAYGFVAFSFVLGLLRALLLLSGIEYIIEAALFFAGAAAVLYVIALGLSRIRPMPNLPARQEPPKSSQSGNPS